ncbi:MAG: hypothetical protein P0107_03535 [Nitrosomonas sp.]|nr:hypothetical protein [Nitrosomonas sp.]
MGDIPSKPAVSALTLAFGGMAGHLYCGNQGQIQGKPVKEATEYKVDKSASQKFTAPLIDHTQINHCHY